MKTFKQYFTEATKPPVDNWKELQDENPMLATGVRLLRQIEKLGGEALIVGGSVRDIILGKPIKDVDIATNVPLEKIKQKFKWNDIGQSGKLGITMVHFGGHEYEVANYRQESGTSDARHPDKVEMIQNFEGDSARRDLTINSMGLNSKGEIIDYQGGIDDLKNGIIRSVGKANDRFTEDALRIIRTARFASKYGFDIEDDTKKAMKDLGHLIDDLSSERISGELEKISSNGKHLANYIEHLDDVGLLERILPEVKALQGSLQNPEHHPEGDVYNHVISALKHSRSSNPITNLAILFHDIAKPLTYKKDVLKGHTYHGHDKESANLVKEIGKRLKFPNEITKALEFVAANHMKAHHIYDMSKRKVTQLVNNPYWPILKDVVYADEMSRGDIGKDGKEEFEAKIKYAENIAAEISGEEGAEGERKKLKEKIDGYKVMQWTGLQPGQEMGHILKTTQDWLYSNMDATEKQVKDYVMALYADIIAKQPKSLEECYGRMYGQEEIQRIIG